MKCKLKILIFVLFILILTFILTACGSGSGSSSKTYSLTVNTTGEGEVAISPDKAKYNQNEVVFLDSTPDPGWGFAYWEGSVDSNLSEIAVQMINDIYLNAVFGISIYTDNFNNDDGKWYTGNYDNNYLKIINGKYTLTLNNSNYILSSTPDISFSGDFYAEVDFVFTSSYYQSAGFIFNKDANSRYYIEFDKDKEYSISRAIDIGGNTQWDRIVDWKTAPELKINGVNEIACRKRGNNYTFYLNGVYIDQINVTHNSPNLGLLASSGPSTPVSVYFDNYRLLVLDSDSGVSTNSTNTVSVTGEARPNKK